MRAPGSQALLVLAALTLACGVPRRAPTPPARAPFAFATDTFAFSNGLVGEYVSDRGTNRMRWRWRDDPPTFSWRCTIMARLARQFFLHARFDPARPRTDRATYARLVDAVEARDPREADPEEEPIVIPGYPSLRRFSAAHAEVLQAAMPSSRPSYLQRGNWRMIFPFSDAHQRRVARRLVAAVDAGWPPILHVLRFPRTTINHVVVVLDAEESPEAVRYTIYDPNDARAPLTLVWDRGAATFRYPATSYFMGGPVKAYEIYRDALY